MPEFKPPINDKPLILSLLFFTILSTQRVSELSFQAAFEIHPYFLAIAVVIFGIKLFFSSFSGFSKDVIEKNTVGLLFNLGFVVAQIWLIQTGVQYMVEVDTPIETFKLLAIASGLFVMQLYLNGFKLERKTAIFTTIYYAAIYGVLINMGEYSYVPTAQVLQFICIVPPLLELWQLVNTILYKNTQLVSE
jgi:hypothetical protein